MSGDELKKSGGRRPRPKPNHGAGADWLANPISDPIRETARQFVLNLNKAIHQKLPGESTREAARQIGVDHNSLRRIQSGDAYPDLVFMVKAEAALHQRLWPELPTR